MTANTIYSLAGLTPLIVEDHPGMRSMMVVVLRRLGAERILQASSAKETMSVMRFDPPDFAMIDYRLGEIDGITLVENIRTGKESPNPYLPIIMMSGYADPNVVIRARDAGVNEFLAKPVSVESIATRLSMMIEKSRPFVRAGGFFGPDRRRRKAPITESPRRRISDGHIAENDAEGAAEGDAEGEVKQLEIAS